MILKEFFYDNGMLNRNKLKESYVRDHLPEEYSAVKEFQKINNLYDFERFSQILYHYCNNMISVPLCNYCKKDNNNFLGFDLGYSPGCCGSCNIQLTRPKSNLTRKLNTIEKYGVEHTTQLDSVKEKMKNTNLEKYGVEHYSQTEEYKRKVENTNLEKYGVKNYTQTEEYKKKSERNMYRKIRSR
jgi:hypothetical protein